MHLSIDEIAVEIPEQTLTATEMAKTINVSVDFIYEKLRMHEKRITQPSETPFDLALKAVKKLQDSSKFSFDNLDFIIYASNGIFDFQMWSPSAKIQDYLIAKKAFTFDLINGCNSGSMGIYLAKHLMLNPNNLTGLLVVSDTLSKFINYSDPSSLPFFICGDGAAAILLSKKGKFVLKSCSVKTDGRYVECCRLPFGGTDFYDKNKISDIATPERFIQFRPDNHSSESTLVEILIQNYIAVVDQALKEANSKAADLSLFLTNQNSKIIIDSLLRHFSIPYEKTCITSETYGHMAAVDTFFALKNCLDSGKIYSGNKILLASAGIGYHWGAFILEVA